MSTKDRVFSRLFDGQKHNLNTNLSKEHKVALSLVAEIDNEYDWLAQAYDESSYGEEFMQGWEDRILDFHTELSIAVDNYVINGAAYSLEDAASNMQAKIENLEVKADELGIDPADLVSNYADIKDILANADMTHARFRDAYKEVVRTANNGLADFS